jgi:hypothetical protein
MHPPSLLHSLHLLVLLLPLLQPQMAIQNKALFAYINFARIMKVFCASIAQPPPAPAPPSPPRLCLRLRLTPHQKQARFRLQMLPLSVTMSSTEGRQLQRRLDVRVEASSFAARPLFL